MKIPVTWLSLYQFCKRKLYLEQVLGLKEEIPKEVLVLGKIKHDALDFANKQEKGIVLSINENNINEIELKYRNAQTSNLTNSVILNKEGLRKIGKEPQEVFKELLSEFEIEALTRAERLREFIVTNKIYGLELWDKLEPKIKTEVYVESEKLELKGKIDRLEIFQDRWMPIEVKTGKPPSTGVWEPHLIQIAAYIMLIEELGNKVDLGIVEYINDKIKREVRLNPFLRDEVLKLKDKVKIILESKELPGFADNENKCRNCGLRKECYGMQ